MKLMRHLSTGEIAMDNIVWILMLERAKFQSCKNTVAMRYSKVTKLFWSIVYRLCKSSGLKFFAGEKKLGTSGEQWSVEGVGTHLRNQK